MAKREERERPASTSLFVLALGLLIGFVIGFVLLLSRLPVDAGPENLAAGEVGVLPEDAPSSYEFFDVLPGERVARVPETLAVAVEEAPPELLRASVRPATRPVPGETQRLDRRDLAREAYREIPASSLGQESYYLQAGSFRSADEAERARAVVLLLGLDAFIVTRLEGDGSTGHRVRVGPFFDASRLGAARDRLKREGVPYEIIRVTG